MTYSCARPNDQNSDRGIETEKTWASSSRALGPNDQNSDRGIETISVPALHHFHGFVRTTRIPTEELKPGLLWCYPNLSHVRTTRIPTEELKRRWPSPATSPSRRVRTTRIPTEELKPSPHPPGRECWARPNDQNSDRGIETTGTAAVPAYEAVVRTTRIPTEELKRLTARSRRDLQAGPNDQNSDRGIET